ncbi:MAG: hypothetical protein IH623_23585 [Verrucomicrobia bacterium]|nr:hypothetical protein [Verrucomicrobiota bacterium]
MKTHMLKTILTLMAITVSFALVAQTQPPVAPGNDEQESPIPEPAEIVQQLLAQNGNGTNGFSEEAVAELVRAALEAQQAMQGTNLSPGENLETQDSRGPRSIRGQGTRGTMGSSSNALSLGSLLAATSANQPANGASGLRLNFRNAPLSLVLDYLSDAAGFVISANSKVDLKGTVTVWSNQPVNRTEAIRLLNTSLMSSGYAATVEGNLLNIYVVDATNTEIIAGVPGNSYTNIPPTKDMVTQIVYISNVEANQLIQSLQPLMPTGTSMTPNQGANAIVITDTRANIRRMVQLVKALDTASVSSSSLKVFPLVYSDATALAQVVTQLFQTDTGSNRGGQQGGFRGFFGGGFPGGGDPRRGDNNAASSQAGRVAAPRVVAVADDRSNSLVVSASEEQMLLVVELVSQMDVDVDDIMDLRLFRLRHADPQETADLLTSLFPDPTTQQSNRGQGGRGFPFGLGGMANNRGTTTDQNSRQVRQTKVTAVPDPRTGSVIVSAAQNLMAQIADIVEQLDSDPSRKMKVTVIKVENRDPQEVVEQLQSVIATDNNSNVNRNRNTTRQTGSQLNTRQQNNLQNRNTTGGLNTGFGTGNTRTGR